MSKQADILTVTLKDLAEEFHISEKGLRQKLRKLKVRKPNPQWRFEEGSTEVEKVRELLSETSRHKKKESS